MSDVIQERIEVLFADLVPGMGKCDTQAGELVRAVCKLRYEMYNNGFGNNVSGPLNFIEARVPNTHPEHAKLHDNARGRMYNGNYKAECPTVQAMNSLATKVLDYIDANPSLKEAPNHDDMYDYGEDELCECEECGVELTWHNESGMGFICSDCYEMHEEEECY